MDSLLTNVTNSIWHAFDSLAANDSETVLKSKLKVLTANIGILLDLYGVEKGLDHYRSTNSLNFEHFKFYLQNEVFCSVPQNLSLKEAQELEGRIEEVCWLVCQKHYLQRESSRLTDQSVYHLFRIFCFFADLVQSSSSPNKFQALMHSSEVGWLAADLASSLGLEWDSDEFEAISSATISLKFSLFLAFIEGRLGLEVEREPLQEAINAMYHTLIGDVIKKGNLLKKGYLLPTLREYWFVLQTTELNYYKTRGENDACGCIPLNPQSRVDAPPNPGKDKVHKILIHSMDRTFELAAFDHRTKLQWISAIQLAINHSGGHESYQRIQAARRRAQRDAGTLKIKEEAMIRTSQKREIETTKEKLKQEIEAREAADQKARQLQDSLEEQQNRAKELIAIRNKLEKLLEEETQSKRDEEIVRNLQARVLREEWEKREELERLQEEQTKMLEEEREKRVEFERLQTEKEEELKAAQARLQALEDERQALDEELKSAREKILRSEQSKEILEAQIRVIGSQIRDSDRLRRAMSFVGTSYERYFMEPEIKTPRRDKAENS
ncbi:hypothetical protein RUM43_003410 [Polyplax serrata]|uniref:PH domain-containing protein n=1 Tax=Polyplax serrata TaxID=468196 RepID=A0AAN8PEI1_POLSC